MLGIHWRKIALVLLPLMALPFFSFGQLNYQNFENKQLYFGITLGVNSSFYRISQSQEFIYDDTVATVNAKRGPGFNLGIVSNLKMGKYFDLRFIPTLVFADKGLNYQMFDGTEVNKGIESIYIEFPMLVRFKSQPIKDVRVYVMAGMKYGIDLASNAKARRAEDQVKVARDDISVEYGLGIQFFFPLFIFSPEIKFSQGIIDVHSRDPNLIYSRVIDKLFSRTFTFSILFEG